MNNVAKLRKQNRLHQRDIAQYLGIKLSEYSSLEKSLDFKDINHVVKLMTLFKCSFMDIVPIEGLWEPFNRKKLDTKPIVYNPDISELIDSDGNITVYKYKPFSEYIMTDILNNQIIMSYAKDLNDPFEGLCGYTINGIDCIGYSKYDSLAIASFSLVSDNPMMWALYSQKYKGLCYKLKINVKSVRDKGLLVGQVKYEEVKPMIKVETLDGWWNTRNTEYYHNLLFTKRKEWISEKEVRIIYEPDYMVTADSIEHLIETDGRIGRVNNQLHFFNDFELCEIIIGYLMNKSDRIKVISWAKQKGIKVSVAYPNNYQSKIITAG